jgi:hypothetical protein
VEDRVIRPGQDQGLAVVLDYPVVPVIGTGQHFRPVSTLAGQQFRIVRTRQDERPVPAGFLVQQARFGDPPVDLDAKFPLPSVHEARPNPLAAELRSRDSRHATPVLRITGQEIAAVGSAHPGQEIIP